MKNSNILKGIKEKIKNGTVNEIDMQNLDEIIDLLAHGNIEVIIDESRKKAAKYGPLKNTDEFIGALMEEVQETDDNVYEMIEKYNIIKELKMSNCNLDKINKLSFEMICVCINIIKESADIIAVLNKFEDYYNEKCGGNNNG